MGITIIPKDSINRIPEIAINARSVVQPTTFYECPANKKAIFIGTVQCTGRGAAGQARLFDPSQIFYHASWVTNTPSANRQAINSLFVGEAIPIVFELDAGDVIKTDQNTGTNAEFNIVGKILEVSA